MTIQHRQSSPIQPIRVVVLGSSGFVGADLTAHLKTRGVATLPLSSKDLNLTDVACVNKLSSLLKPTDSLVMVSALTPDKGRDVNTLMRNFTMAQHVSGVLEKTKLAHFVYISSDAVYPDDANPVRETTVCSPNSFHGLMHFGREQMLTQAVKKNAIPCLMLRPCAVYGAKDTHNSYGPNRFMRSALSERTITMFGQGEEQRDHVCIHDLTRLTCMALAQQSEGVLNVATGAAVSFMDVAQSICKLCKEPVQFDCRPRATPITHRHFDATNCLKAFPAFRWTALDEGLGEMHREMSARC